MIKKLDNKFLWKIFFNGFFIFLLPENMWFYVGVCISEKETIMLTFYGLTDWRKKRLTDTAASMHRAYSRASLFI